MRSFQSFFQYNSFARNCTISDEKRKIGYEEFYQSCNLLAGALKNIGFLFQEKAVIVSKPCIEWSLCDIALIKLGVISIPMFSNLSQETIKYQIEDSKPDYIFVEDIKTYEIIKSAANYSFKKVILFQGNEFDNIEHLIKNSHHNFNETDIDQSSIATIIYTSGTAGHPKGVILTYSNLAYQLTDIHTCFPEVTCKDIAISILPFAHVFQRMINYLYTARGVTVYIVNDISNVVKYLQDINPTFMTIVPRVLEKVYANVKSRIEDRPKVIRYIVFKIFEYASRNVIKNSISKYIIDILFSKKVKEIFGNRMSLVVSGGAKLGRNEEIFFYNIGLPLLQGYGMTECSPVIAANTKVFNRLFTVGKPFSSVEVKIAENYEICIRGGSVFKGYVGNEPRNPLEFYPTGDLGFIDEDGYLTVKGRLREQFKTANGKFVNPILIESLLNEINGIDNACIIAEGKPFVVAILFSKRTDFDKLHNDIEEVNKHLDHHQQVQYFHIAKEEPSIENHIITPSMKIRRNFIESKYASEIESLYKNTKKA